MAAPGPPHGISSHDATKFRRPKSNFVAQPRNGVRILRGDFSTKSARTVQPPAPRSPCLSQMFRLLLSVFTPVFYRSGPVIPPYLKVIGADGAAHGKSFPNIRLDRRPARSLSCGRPEDWVMLP